MIGENKAATALENCIEESLTLQSNRFRNQIKFANSIMNDKFCHKDQQHLRYNLNKCVKKGGFDILNNISGNVTFVQLMDSLWNVNHDISILDYWIFDSDYLKKLHLKRESLDLIFSPSVVEEKVVKFETVFYSIRYLDSPGNPKIG